MRYFLDTEFYERPNTISLISMAIVADDGREFYFWNVDYDKKANEDEWLKNNVFCFAPPIENNSRWIRGHEFRNRIMEFVGEDDFAEFWGYYADYDWVIFCWQFGRMIDLPKKFPMYCRDIKQEIDAAGNPRIPKQHTEHDALADARWIRDTYNYLLNKEKRC